MGFYTGRSEKRLVLYVNYFRLALHRPCNFYLGRSYGSAIGSSGSFPALVDGFSLTFVLNRPFLHFLGW